MKAKIIKGIGGFYYCKPEDSSFLFEEEDLIECKPRGVFRYQNQKPVVGDNVILEKEDSGWVISKILTRKNTFLRPNISNVDLALICLSVHSPDPNFVLIDSLLINSELKGIKPIICITKSDLDLEKAKEIQDEYKRLGYPIYLLSTEQEDDLNFLIEELKNKTAFMAGNSGVGKSSLSNRLCQKQMEVGNISQKLKRGRHTTRHSELIPTKYNGFLLDTPGFSALALEDEITEENLKNFYPEFKNLNCFYNNCSHINEPKCGVKKAVKEGKINRERYKRYRNLYNSLKNKKKF